MGRIRAIREDCDMTDLCKEKLVVKPSAPDPLAAPDQICSNSSPSWCTPSTYTPLNKAIGRCTGMSSQSQQLPKQLCSLGSGSCLPPFPAHHPFFPALPLLLSATSWMCTRPSLQHRFLPRETLPLHINVSAGVSHTPLLPCSSPSAFPHHPCPLASSLPLW